MKIDVYTLNAFAEDINGGNPAGVVIDADSLHEEDMLAIAKKVGFSETAFVSKSDKADFKVRFFTPSEEVDFCGHATIATFYLLNYLGIISAGTYTQQTGAGVLSVTVSDDNLITMEQANPKFLDKITKYDKDFEIVCKSLGISDSDIGALAKGILIDHLEVVSTGLADLIIPLKSVEILNSVNPDFALISEISKKYGITGYHVFSLTENSTAQCRNFAPIVAIDEESATGSSSGALASYLIKNKIIQTEKTEVDMFFEQGLTMGKPSKIYIKILKDNGNRVSKVFVGGRACDVKKVEVTL